MMLRTTRTLTLASIAAIVAGCASTPQPTATAPATTPAPPQVITPSDARVMAGNCFACHGPDGHSPGTIPSLDKLAQERIVSSMKYFRTGEASSTVMGRHAKAYSDAEIEAIAGYITSLSRKP